MINVLGAAHNRIMFELWLRFDFIAIVGDTQEFSIASVKNSAFPQLFTAYPLALYKEPEEPPPRYHDRVFLSEYRSINPAPKILLLNYEYSF